jgi:hypothetical protein
MPLEPHPTNPDLMVYRARKYDLPQLDSTGTAAVDHNYFWQPISTCPRGAKVQLLGQGGVAMYGTDSGKEKIYTHWAPLPKLLKEKTNG